MIKFLLKIMVLPLILTGTAGVFPAAAEDGTGSDRVILYKNGSGTAVSADGPCRKKITGSSLELLENADDTMRLIISDALIEKIKKDETAVEIIFAVPKEVAFKKPNVKKQITNILIPVTGHFAEGRTVVFYADPNYGLSNQAINRSDKIDRSTIESCVSN